MVDQLPSWKKLVLPTNVPSGLTWPTSNRETARFARLESIEELIRRSWLVVRSLTYEDTR
jgi:hypothetical protein